MQVISSLCRVSRPWVIWLSICDVSYNTYPLYSVLPFPGKGVGKSYSGRKRVWILGTQDSGVPNIQTHLTTVFNTLRPIQNGRRFADDTFKGIFLNENVRISIKISLKFVPEGPINNSPALVQIMAWRRLGDKPLSKPMMVCLLTHICVTRSQWVNYLCNEKNARRSFICCFRYIVKQVSCY